MADVPFLLAFAAVVALTVAASRRARRRRTAERTPAVRTTVEAEPEEASDGR